MRHFNTHTTHGTQRFGEHNSLLLSRQSLRNGAQGTGSLPIVPYVPRDG